jgi:neutral ceramidase
MPNILHLSFVILHFAFVTANCSLPSPVCAAAEPIQAGIAVADITPPIPYRMSGYFYERLSTGTKDPLKAKAIVFQQGNASAAIVFCDLVGIPRDVSMRARREASAATGIPVEHIAIAATHTHTGPLYFGALHKHLHERAVARFGKDPYEVVDYPAQLIERMVSAIVEAKRNLKPAQLAAGYAHEERLAFNRRFFMKDGTVRFNPGELNPDIVRPAGPIDPQVGIISISDSRGGKPSAAIVSFAMHLDTVGGTEYSADYPKFVEDELRKTLGPEFKLLFGAGTCGDINHIDVTTRNRRPTDKIGLLLSETIGKMIEEGSLKRVDEPSLAVRSAKVEAPLQRFSEAERAQARKNMELVGGRELPFLEQVRACTIMDLERRGADTLPLEVQAFRLGPDTAIVTLPGEVFVELGLAIKAVSPFKTTLVVELTNDSPAYIPTKKAFAEGSYEIVNSRVQPGSGERLVEAATRLLKELE